MKKCESLFDWLKRLGLLGGLLVLEAYAVVSPGRAFRSGVLDGDHLDL